MWLDVDVALAEVPVNCVALIDDTDFKTREESVTYNQAGMDLVWNFVTSAGAYTQTAVVPTTAGLHDWVNQGNGMYSIEIPASGGTINNDTEGYGWFTGFATGILPWSGPIIGFRAAGLNNLLIDSAYSATRGLSGTALPNAVADAAGGLPISDAGGLDIDTKLANTNEVTTARMGALTDLIDGGRLDLLIDAILLDTGTTLENRQVTIATDAARLTAVRAAILTDWINGGRLDLLLDAIPTTAMRGTDGANTTVPDAAGVAPTAAEIKTEVEQAGSTLAQILTDTAAQDTTTKLRTLMTGADTPVCKDSTPLTAAETESECNDALVALNLDHLMKVAVSNRDTIPEIVDDTVLANIMTKTDGDTSDFDHATDSLEAIKDSGGGDVNVTQVEGQALSAKVGDNFNAFFQNAGGDTAKKVDDVGGGAAGSGDYEVTLTIRTTGGAAVPGVRVWVNTSNDRTGAVAGTLETNDSGQVVFDLDYTKYYIFCHLSTYTFAPADMTPASGSVTFTKDIATAISVPGSSDDYDDSFLSRAIVAVREHLDEPTINAKYSDNDLIRQLEMSYILVLGEKNRNALTPAVGRVTITLASGTTEYILPYTVGSIEAIYEGVSGGGRIFYAGRGQYNPLGRRLWVEGNVIHFQDTGFLSLGTELTVEYTPAGIARLHNGACTINADGDEITLGATPNVGTIDTHVDAYIGNILRVLKVSGTTVVGNMLQERTITEYDNSTRKATILPVLNPVPTTNDGTIFYEVAPAIHKGLDMVVALHAAKTIAGIEGLGRAGNIKDAYAEAIRHVRLTAYYSNIQDASSLHSDNFDNRRY